MGFKLVDVSWTVYCSYAFMLYNDSKFILKMWFFAAKFTNKEKMNSLNTTDIIQYQNVWKMRLICQLKYTLSLQWKQRFINPPRWLTMFLDIFSKSATISPHIQKLQFFRKRFFLNLNLKTRCGWHCSAEMTRNYEIL